MKASKFTDAQKAFIVKQGEEGTPVAEICRKAGISQATYFNWSAGGKRKASSGHAPTLNIDTTEGRPSKSTYSSTLAARQRNNREISSRRNLRGHAVMGAKSVWRSTWMGILP